MSHGIVQNSLGLYCPSVELSWEFPYILPFYPHVPACHLVPQSSYSPMGWTGLSMGFSHVPSWGLSQCPVPSCSPVGWDWTVHGILTCPILKYTSKSQCPVPSHSPVGWDGTFHGILTCPTLGYIPVSRPIPQSCGMDGIVHGILTCPILEYTSKSQCPVPAHSPVGWTGLSMEFSHVPSSNIPPNPSVLSQPTVPWDCPLDSHMSPFHVD